MTLPQRENDEMMLRNVGKTVHLHIVPTSKNKVNMLYKTYA